MNASTPSPGAPLPTGAVFAVDNELMEEVSAAATALGGKRSYGWRTAVTVPPGAECRLGPAEGKTERNGYTHVTMTFFENPLEIVRKGSRGAYRDRDGVWVTAEEAEDDAGPGRFMVWFVRNVQTPAVQAAELLSYTDSLAKQAGLYSGRLMESGARKLLRFRRDADDPRIMNATGSVKFWLKDGLIAKYEFTLKGSVNWDGETFDNDRTTTVEVAEVDRTRLEVPAGAKRKLS